MSALPPKADMGSARWECRLCANSGLMHCRKTAPFNHLVGGGPYVEPHSVNPDGDERAPSMLSLTARHPARAGPMVAGKFCHVRRNAIIRPAVTGRQRS